MSIDTRSLIEKIIVESGLSSANGLFTQVIINKAEELKDAQKIILSTI